MLLKPGTSQSQVVHSTTATQLDKIAHAFPILMANSEDPDLLVSKIPVDLDLDFPVLVTFQDLIFIWRSCLCEKNCSNCT